MGLGELPRWEALDPESVDRASLESVLGRLSRRLPTWEWDHRGLELRRVLTRRWRNGSREPATCLYVVTKQAYYGSEGPWAEVGHDPAIGAIGAVVRFGLVVSPYHNHPVLCRPLPGSLADTVSLDTTLQLLEGFGLGRITLVVDRAIVSRENVAKVVAGGHHLLGMVRGWNEETRALATRWSETKLERTEFVVARSHGNAAYARGFVGPLFGQPKVRVVAVSDARRRVEERQSRDLLIQELGGPLPRGRLGEIRRELGSVVVPSVGRREFRVDPKALERERKLDGRFLLFHTDPTQEAAGGVPNLLPEGGDQEGVSDGEGTAVVGAAPLPSEGSDRGVCEGGVSGVSVVELGGAEVAGEIPRDDARGGVPPSRRGGVEPVHREEIGPGLDHEDDHRTSGTAPDSRSGGLPACPVNAQKLRLRPAPRGPNI